MIEVEESIYKNLNLNKYSEFCSKLGEKPPVLVGQLIAALLKHESGPKAINSLNRSPQTFNRNIKKLFPNVSLTGGNQTWKHWLVSKSDYKYCNSCSTYHLRTEYTNDISSSDGLYRECKSCRQLSNKDWYGKNKDYHKQYLIKNRADYNARNAKRRALLLQRTVYKDDIPKIKEIYRNCPEGYHVDHIVPLQNPNISGLHVSWNLQYLPAKENLSKGNSFGDVAKLVETHET